MNAQISSLLKIFIATLILAAIIKYILPPGFNQPSNAVALIAILLPVVVLGLLLWWRSPEPE